jgi:hypothetical protein
MAGEDQAVFKVCCGSNGLMVLSALLLAIGLGVYLLMPGSQKRMVFSRSKLAVAHGLLGTLGFAGYIWMLSKTDEQASMIVWTAVSLVTLGLLLGIAIYVMTRYSHRKPDLILTSHVILAGMGALVMVALILI